MAKEEMQIRDEVELIVRDKYGKVKKRIKVGKVEKVEESG